MKISFVSSIQLASVLPLALFTILSSCSAISESVGNGLTRATKRPGSFETRKETVSVSIHNETASGDAVKFPSKPKAASGVTDPNAGYKGLPVALAAAAAGYIVDGIEKGVESAAGNYSVVYTGSRIDDDLPGACGFDLTRTISGKDAAKMRLNFRRSGNAYTLGLSSIQLAKSKAAIPFWDDDVDMVVKVQLGILDPEKNSMVQVVDAEFTAKNVVLGDTTEFNDQEQRTTWFRFPSFQTDSSNPEVPYKLTITIQETSDFYKVAEKGKTLVAEKNKDWTKSLTEAISAGD